MSSSAIATRYCPRCRGDGVVLVDWPSFPGTSSKHPQVGLDWDVPNPEAWVRRVRRCPRCKGRRCIPRTPEEIEALQRHRERARRAQPIDEFTEMAPVRYSSAHILIPAALLGLTLWGVGRHWAEVLTIMRYGGSAAVQIAYELRGPLSFLVWIPLTVVVAIFVNSVNWWQPQGVYWQWFFRFALILLILFLGIELYGPNLRADLNTLWDWVINWPLLRQTHERVRPEIYFGALAIASLIGQSVAVRYVKTRWWPGRSNLG